ncbi:MAG: restriction endonuclease subunit S [Chloroflexi bacterium]|nr:restriction endonuclease subunit S [Chloroflexota bacterium]
MVTKSLNRFGDILTELQQITDIQNGQVDWDKVPYCDCPVSERGKYFLVPGDILFARTGATTGKSFLLEDEIQAVFASYLIRLRARPDIRPKFAYLFFQTPQYWQQVAAGRRGGAQPNMNAELLANIVLPVPPLSTQDKLADQLDARLAHAEKAQTAAQAQLDAIAALPGALLEQVFGGFEPPA